MQILIDDKPLTELDASWYRGQIGVVAQDPRLFSNTIAANITYGCPGKTQVCLTVVYASDADAEGCFCCWTCANSGSSEMSRKCTTFGNASSMLCLC